MRRRYAVPGSVRVVERLSLLRKGVLGRVLTPGNGGSLLDGRLDETSVLGERLVVRRVTRRVLRCAEWRPAALVGGWRRLEVRVTESRGMGDGSSLREGKVGDEVAELIAKIERVDRVRVVRRARLRMDDSLREDRCLCWRGNLLTGICARIDLPGVWTVDDDRDVRLVGSLWDVCVREVVGDGPRAVASGGMFGVGSLVGRRRRQVQSCKIIGMRRQESCLASKGREQGTNARAGSNRSPRQTSSLQAVDPLRRCELP